MYPRQPGRLGLHRDHGLEHGGVPPGRVPLGDEGQGRAAPSSSTSIRASRAPARWRTSTRRSAPASDIAFLGGLINYVHRQRALEHRSVLPASTSSTTPTPRRSSTRSSRTPRTSDGVFSGLMEYTDGVSGRINGFVGAVRRRDLAVRAASAAGRATRAASASTAQSGEQRGAQSGRSRAGASRRRRRRPAVRRAGPVAAASRRRDATRRCRTRAACSRS